MSFFVAMWFCGFVFGFSPPPPTLPQPRRVVSINAVEKGSKKVDMSSLAAAVAGLSTLGLLIPATDLELATVVAVSAGYAATQNDTSVGELVRAVGRLGESTLRKGLDATFGEPTDSGPELVNATIEVFEATKEELPPSPPPPRLTKRLSSRPLDAKTAAGLRDEARRELERIEASERELRLLETRLRAARREKRVAKERTVEKPDHAKLGLAIESLERVKSTLNSHITPHAPPRNLDKGLDLFEMQLRDRETHVRASLDEADLDTRRKRQERALEELSHQLRILDMRRKAARAKLARASVCLVRDS